MIKNARKLFLNKESLRQLSNETLSVVVSGRDNDPISENKGNKSAAESQCHSCVSCLAVSCGCNPNTGFPVTA